MTPEPSVTNEQEVIFLRFIDWASAIIYAALTVGFVGWVAFYTSHKVPFEVVIAFIGVVLEILRLTREHYDIKYSHHKNSHDFNQFKQHLSEQLDIHSDKRTAEFNASEAAADKRSDNATQALSEQIKDVPGRVAFEVSEHLNATNRDLLTLKRLWPYITTRVIKVIHERTTVRLDKYLIEESLYRYRELRSQTENNFERSELETSFKDFDTQINKYIKTLHETTDEVLRGQSFEFMTRFQIESPRNPILDGASTFTDDYFEQTPVELQNPRARWARELLDEHDRMDLAASQLSRAQTELVKAINVYGPPDFDYPNDPTVFDAVDRRHQMSKDYEIYKQQQLKAAKPRTRPEMIDSENSTTQS